MRIVIRGERVSRREWKEGEKEWSKDGHCEFGIKGITVWLEKLVGNGDRLWAGKLREWKGGIAELDLEGMTVFCWCFP